MTDYKAFLDDLAALTRKHRLIVAGCGCCGSPFLLEPGDFTDGRPAVTPEGSYTANAKGEYLEWSELEAKL